MSNPVISTTAGQMLLDASIQSIIDKYQVSVLDMIDEIQDHMSRSGFPEAYSAAVDDYIFDAFVKAGF